MNYDQLEPINETIFDEVKRINKRGIALLEKAKEAEKIKLKNGFHWVTIDAKTRVLRKIKK